MKGAALAILLLHSKMMKIEYRDSLLTISLFKFGVTAIVSFYILFCENMLIV